MFALYSMQLFWVTREKSHFYYMLYISSFGLFHASLFGLGYQYLWPNSPGLQHYSVPLFMLIAIFSALRFAHHFLKLEKTAREAVLYLRSVSGLSLILLIALPLIPYGLATQFALMLVLAGAVMLLLTSFIVWRKQRNATGYFFFGWIVFLIAVIASASDKLGWSHLGIMTDHIMQLGITVQVGMIALALATRLQHEKRQRLFAQHKNTHELQRLVKERTADLEYANRQLDAMSHTDGLTGLKNRRYFDEELDRQFKSAVRHRWPLSLAILDIDHFKHINDRYGHMVGDDFLRLISAVIAAEIKRPMDTAARFGGEEFVLILPDTPQEGVASIAECIRSAVESINHKVGKQHVPVTISIGTVSLTPSGDAQSGDLLQITDQALYQAKHQGRNRVISC